MPIVVVGSTNIDLIVALPRLPAVGETVAGGRFLQAFGGKGANQAVAAARAGGEVVFITAVGSDEFGAAALAGFAHDGVDASAALRVDGPTGTAVILVGPAGDNVIALAPGANDALDVAAVDALAEQIGVAELVMLQMEIPPATTARVLELAAARGVPVLCNYAPARPDGPPVSAAMTGLVVNEVEAEALTGAPVRDPAGALAAAAALLARGPAYVIVTLGAAGAALASGELRLHVPAFPVAAVDATAAGDAFCGALAVALVEGQPLPEAVRFASAAGALAATRAGAQPSLPTREAIEALLRQSAVPS